MVAARTRRQSKRFVPTTRPEPSAKRRLVVPEGDWQSIRRALERRGWCKHGVFSLSAYLASHKATPVVWVFVVTLVDIHPFDSDGGFTCLSPGLLRRHLLVDPFPPEEHDFFLPGFPDELGI